MHDFNCGTCLIVHRVRNDRCHRSELEVIPMQHPPPCVAGDNRLLESDCVKNPGRIHSLEQSRSSQHVMLERLT